MRDRFPHKKPGDRLSANHINRLSSAVSRITSGWRGSNVNEHDGTVSGQLRTDIRVVRVTDEDVDSSESSGSVASAAYQYVTFDCRVMYYDRDAAKWVVDPDGGVYLFDPGSLRFRPSVGDVFLAWFDPLREAYIPASPSPGATKIRFRIYIVHSGGHSATVDVLGSNKVTSQVLFAVNNQVEVVDATEGLTLTSGGLGYADLMEYTEDVESDNSSSSSSMSSSGSLSPYDYEESEDVIVLRRWEITSLICP